MDNYYKATCWTLAHALMFSLSGIFIKILSPEIGVFEQVFYRAAFSLIVVILIYRPAFSECFKAEALPSLVSRGIFGFLGTSSIFYAMSELPLAIAMVLTLTTPVFVMILGHFSVNEKMKPSQLMPVFLTLVGISLIFDLNFSDGIQTNIPLFPAAIGLLGSFLTAIAFLSMRSALKKVGASIVVFWFSLTNLIGASAIVITDLKMPTEDNVFFIIILCALGLLSDITKTMAYKHAVAWFVSLLSLISVAFSIFWGWLVFDEYIVVVQVIGIGIMLTGITMTILKSRAKPA
jgi:drug/metabolite transporter (DMT)-like permease